MWWCYRDQELRFTVHDSPDYYKLKVSVFNEDKTTALIGEAWVDLDSIILPGGGKGDLWQGLTCKGKYAGEIRVELTYYDSREKPETKEETVSMAEELRQQYGTLQPKVKRRPLPTNPNAPATTDVVIPERPMPGRAKHGPRDFQVANRMASAPAAKTYNYPQSETTLFGQKGVQALSQGSLPASQPHLEPLLSQRHEEHEQNPDPEAYHSYGGVPAQSDFLPQLAPSSRARGSLPPQPRYSQRHQSQPQPPVQPRPRPVSHIGISHSHSAPIVPVTHQIEPQAYDDSYQLRTDYPQPIPDVEHQYRQVAISRQRRDDVPPGWQDEYDGAYSDKQAYVEEDVESSPPPPPPPPMHSNSAPVVPHYRMQHGQPQPPMPRHGVASPAPRQQYVPNSSPLQGIERDYGQQHSSPHHRRPSRGPSFDEFGGVSPYQSSYHSTPNLSSPVGQQSPSPYARTSPYQRQAAGLNSITEIHGTPSRQPHPLSQEMPRARSPNPYGTPEHQISYNHYDRARETSVPLIKPRAMSPAPSPSQSASAPRSTYSLQFPVRAFESSDASPLSTSGNNRTSFMPRKSVSPQPSMSETGGSSIPFSPDSFGVHNPAAPFAEAESRKGPILGWHGQEIDPSDHLPVDSWAPEPAKKTPTKTYGLGREKEFGPRSISKDTVINVRMKLGSNLPEQQAQPASSGKSNKVRGVLKKASSQPRYASEPPMDLSRNHESSHSIPDPYENQQHQHYPRSFHEGSPGGYGVPSLPPKVPLSQSPGGYEDDALSREISNIDIGGSRQRQSAAFVPVRSHRDSNSYY